MISNWSIKIGRFQGISKISHKNFRPLSGWLSLSRRADN